MMGRRKWGFVVKGLDGGLRGLCLMIFKFLCGRGIRDKDCIAWAAKFSLDLFSLVLNLLR